MPFSILANLTRTIFMQERKQFWVVDLGLISYGPSFDLQRRIVAKRKTGDVPDILLLCEHPHVITMGRNGNPAHVRANERLLRQMDCEFHQTDRGGDVTYHGPGQIVGYPIFDLTKLRRDVGWYVEQLEEMMIRATADFGVSSDRVAGMHGVWVDVESSSEKLAALGVHLSRWVTSHGFAYNVSTDLRYFDLIIPCGLVGKRATSLEKVLGRRVTSNELKPHLVKHCGDLFGMEPRYVSTTELNDILESEPRMARLG
jgi:lipoyl(octanoyl) transferase